MQLGFWFYVITGLWGVAVIANLMQATRLSYQVEARSEALRNKTGVPRFARIFEVAFDKGVAQDDETQALRREMNKRLLIVLGGFIAFYFFVMLVGPGTGASSN
jgi:membrane protein required for beta-lactamase induction